MGIRNQAFVLYQWRKWQQLQILKPPRYTRTQWGK